MYVFTIFWHFKDQTIEKITISYSLCTVCLPIGNNKLQHTHSSQSMTWIIFQASPVIFTIYTCSYIQEQFHLVPFHTCHGSAGTEGDSWLPTAIKLNRRGRRRGHEEEDVSYYFQEYGKRGAGFVGCCNVLNIQQICNNVFLHQQTDSNMPSVSLVIGLLAPHESIFCQMDITLYIPAMFCFHSHNSRTSIFP